jgi:hypothetical protein
MERGGREERERKREKEREETYLEDCIIASYSEQLE